MLRKRESKFAPLRNIATEHAIGERLCRGLTGTVPFTAMPRLPTCLITLGLVAPAPFGGALAQPAFPDLARCVSFYDLLVRYEFHTTLHTGQKARAEIALDRDCRNGRYREGMGELEAMLRRGLIPVPPRP